MNRIKQLSIWIIAFWMAMTAGAATVQAQSVNMSRYITLTVQSGQPIKLRFQAAAAGTPVLVKSGSNNQTITVGTSWSPDQNFTSDGTTMTVYGDITGFDCSNNRANLTALDVSHNTRLKELFGYNNLLTALDVSACTQLERLSCFENRLTALDVSACTRLKELDCPSNELPALDVSACTQLEGLSCYNNNFSTAALNRLYCSLPDRTGETDKGKIYPAYNATNAGHADVLASSGHIATGKNWEVIYGSDDSDIPTTGTETCGSSALTVSPATLSFVAAGETKPITVTASGAWTAVSSETWLTLSAGSGTGNGSVDATAAAYTGTTSRTAKVTFTAGSVTQEVNVTQQGGNINMSRYITLTVQSGQPIQLAFRAATVGTPLRVVSGSNTTDVTVGTGWSPDQNFTSDGTTMTVYGDITGFG
ncbi:BACON domain-containing protein, partial [Tannerella forsythia]